MPPRLIRMSPPEPAADLLGAPLNIELVLHDTAKRIVDSETSGASPRRSLAGSCVGQVAVIDAPVVLVDVAAHLATDRRGRTLEPPGDLPDPEVLARSVAAQSPSEIRASGRTQGGSSLQCVGRCQLRPALYQRPWCSCDLWGRVWWRGSGGCGLRLRSTARGRDGRGGERRSRRRRAVRSDCRRNSLVVAGARSARSTPSRRPSPIRRLGLLRRVIR